MRQPFVITHDPVEFITVEDQEPFAICSYMDKVLINLDTVKIETDIVAQEFIMIARNENHVGAFTNLAQDFLHNIVVSLRPVPASLQAPTIKIKAKDGEPNSLTLWQIKSVDLYMGQNSKGSPNLWKGVITDVIYNNMLTAEMVTLLKQHHFA